MPRVAAVAAMLVVLAGATMLAVLAMGRVTVSGHIRIVEMARVAVWPEVHLDGMAVRRGSAFNGCRDAAHFPMTSPIDHASRRRALSHLIVPRMTAHRTVDLPHGRKGSNVPIIYPPGV